MTRKEVAVDRQNVFGASDCKVSSGERSLLLFILSNRCLAALGGSYGDFSLFFLSGLGTNSDLIISDLQDFERWFEVTL